MSVEVELVAVKIQMPTNSPVLILREIEEPRRVVPIFIGGPEAHAIDLAISGTKVSRPMTHDLFVDVLDGFDADLEKVEIEKLVQGTFFARLFIKAGEKEMEFSARASDAVAMAARMHAPILMSEEVISEAGVVEADEVEADEDEEAIEELRQFLDTVSPEDFSA